eukprot:525513-Amphidinium_carterae.1
MAVLCLDACAWDNQHGSAALAKNARFIAPVSSAVRPDCAEDSMPLRRLTQLVALTFMSRLRTAKDKLDGTLLSADPLTQVQNTFEMREALVSGIKGAAEETGTSADAALSGKGDDSRSHHTTLARALMATGGAMRSGVLFAPDKPHVACGFLEAERCM